MCRKYIKGHSLHAALFNNKTWFSHLFFVTLGALPNGIRCKDSDFSRITKQKSKKITINEQK